MNHLFSDTSGPIKEGVAVQVEDLAHDARFSLDVISCHPPFDRDNAIYTSSIPEAKVSGKVLLQLPAFLNTGEAGQTDLLYINSANPSSLYEYFTQCLSVHDLNTMHKHLWLAGLIRRPRPLHYHLLRKRNIVIAERADHHLLWRNKDLFIMPLPTYLMDYDIWVMHICPNRQLLRQASGMLLSYICLICSESDLHIAHKSGLLNKDVDWPKWIAFVRSIQGRFNFGADENVNERYQYGELRMTRISLIYRFSGDTIDLTRLLRGYNFRYTSYGGVFERNTAWLMTTIIYVTVVLTAMQVGLASNMLKQSAIFNQFAYGFSLFAILAPLGILLILMIFIVVLALFNLNYAWKHRQKAISISR